MATLKLPGLIDPHVHLRDPGQTEKEDFYTGSCAAIAGGFTTVLDMPNNKNPITTLERLKEKQNIAQEKVVCDTGFYFGSQGDNLEEFEKVHSKVFGLKIYLNETTGNYLLEENKLTHIFSSWSHSMPILLHAEEKTLETVIEILKKIPRPIHICHVSSEYELKAIMKAKEDNLPITCGVTPHHLFLTQDDEKYLGPFGMMKPPLKSKKDVEFLWNHLHAIDVIESDHAPHTKEEKLKKTNGKSPYGVPGLETTLPLLLTAVSQGRLSMGDIVRLCHTNPARILHISSDPSTYVEIDTEQSYVIENKYLHTKCGWSPFDGWKVKGKVERVVLRGKTAYEHQQIIVQPGYGHILPQ